MFNAADEEQWEIIQETIDSSDYYVLILGQRYGSVIESGSDAGISYTEKEFRYAREKKIPVLVFIIDDDVAIKPEFIEKDPESIKKLADFKIEAKKGRTVQWWTNIDELAREVSESLHQQMDRKKRPGWIRGDAFDIEASHAEILSLNKDGRGACGHRKSIDYDSLLVADPIDTNLKTMALPARTVQPVWVQCWIPQSATPGTYQGELLINDGSRLLQRLNLEITVSSRELPQPSEWAYHLDLWQSPYAVARYYQVPLWSQEHFDAMRPLMKMLADAGQKIITATLTHKPWNGQTEDYFDTMVTWMKRADGTWAFDYTIFDRWVEFMMSVGIDKQINCYSMVPWELSFQYYDQATNSLQFVKTAPGEAAYEEMWGAMLASFSKHLKEKGWFDICAIAMDERPMEVMQKTLKVIRKADPDFKVSLAGNYHEEIEPDLYDYCIVIGQNFPEEVRLRRVAENKRTNYYTCCTEAHPNTFTFSDPAEAAWMSYYSSKKHLDGYLRWAYNSWPLEPLLDSRFRSWAGGDTYLVYPGARSCIRFERLIEGIQAHEKINILRQEFEKKGNKAGLKKIEKMLAPFNLGSMPEIPAAITVNRANQILNSF